MSLCCTNSNASVGRSEGAVPESAGLTAGEYEVVGITNDGDTGGKPDMNGAVSAVLETNTFSSGMPGRTLLNIVSSYPDVKEQGSSMLNSLNCC